ncbi:hypothetical protein MBLNU457_6345t1 [Dothideomycetes sp. NU457]
MSLLKLPRELREMIYIYAIRSALSVPCVSTWNPHIRLGDETMSCTLPSLMRVNRQIRCEGLLVFYRFHTFELPLRFWGSRDTTRCLNWITATQDNFRYMEGILLRNFMVGDRAQVIDHTWFGTCCGVKLSFYRKPKEEAQQKTEADSRGLHHYAADAEMSIIAFAPSYGALLTGPHHTIDPILKALALSLHERDMELVLDFHCRCLQKVKNTADD